MVSELLAWLSTGRKEVVAEPYFLEMGLMWILRENLLYRQPFLGFTLYAQPHKREASSSQQCSFDKICWKAIPEILILLFR